MPEGNRTVTEVGNSIGVTCLAEPYTDQGQMEQQTSSLLYRTVPRLPTRNRRHSRLEICATSVDGITSGRWRE